MAGPWTRGMVGNAAGDGVLLRGGGGGAAVGTVAAVAVGSSSTDGADVVVVEVRPLRENIDSLGGDGDQAVARRDDGDGVVDGGADERVEEPDVVRREPRPERRSRGRR